MTGIRYCAIIDTETTSLEPPPVGRAIEIAVMLFDVEYTQRVTSYSSLIQGNENKAQEINGILPETLIEAPEPALVWQAVRWILAPAQVIVAHNSEFDQKFCPDLGKPWICSENDIQWPGRARGGSLVHLALSLGLGVSSSHSAMADVDTLARILTRIAEKGYDLEEMFVHAMRPKALFHSLAPYSQKNIVKAAGFRWDVEKKVWWRRMPFEDAEQLPFQVEMVP